MTLIRRISADLLLLGLAIEVDRDTIMLLRNRVRWGGCRARDCSTLTKLFKGEYDGKRANKSTLL